MKTYIQCAVLLAAAIIAVPATRLDAEARPRKALLIDFAAPEQANGWASDMEVRPVTTAMVSDFASARAVGPADLLPADLGGAGFVRSPIKVPTWMRGRRDLLSIQAMPTLAPAIGGCGARDYAASGLLNAAGEERRRILYPLVAQTACRYGIPVGLFDAMIMQESRYNVTARSPKGAFGLGQLMPGTAAQLGVDRYDIHGNLDGAARYLSGHLREFNQPVLALAAYNAGPGRVRGALRVPRIAETQEYVRQIMLNWRALEWRASARQ